MGKSVERWFMPCGSARVGFALILLITIPGNRASEAVAGRAGFRWDGYETRGQRGTDIQMLRWVRHSKT